MHDQKGIWTSPFHIDRENAKWWALLGGGTAALIAADENLSNRLPESPNRVKFSKNVSKIGHTAAIVSVSRFSARKHFASDILAGGSMGWFIGRYVSQQHLDPNIHKRFNLPISVQSDHSQLWFCAGIGALTL